MDTVKRVRRSSAKGAERKTPHVQRSPYRRIMTAIKHQASLFAAVSGRGDTVIDKALPEYSAGYAAGLEGARQIVDLVFFTDHSNRRGKDGA